MVLKTVVNLDTGFLALWGGGGGGGGREGGREGGRGKEEEEERGRGRDEQRDREEKRTKRENVKAVMKKRNTGQKGQSNQLHDPNRIGTHNMNSRILQTYQQDLFQLEPTVIHVGRGRRGEEASRNSSH